MNRRVNRWRCRNRSTSCRSSKMNSVEMKMRKTFSFFLTYARYFVDATRLSFVLRELARGSQSETAPTLGCAIVRVAHMTKRVS
jgi:hypothetical protein